MAFLSIKDLRSGYSNIEVLKGISIEVNAGEIVTLIGANGAGKTTLLMTVCGSPRASSGKILFNGRDLVEKATHEIVGLGISHSPEGRRIFPHMTVLENLQLGSFKKHFSEKRLRHVYDLFPVLYERKQQRGGTLSGGEQQMLAIGRALMSKPKVLLLDEPSLGIAPKLVNQIFVSIKNINKEKNVTIFLVEQNAKKALELADRAYVLVNGKVTIKGSGQELLKNKDIQAAYLEGGAKN